MSNETRAYGLPEPASDGAEVGPQLQASEPSAALRLAKRALEYIGWFDGSYSPDNLLDADTEIKDLAMAAYRELGEAEPARVMRLKGKHP